MYVYPTEGNEKLEYTEKILHNQLKNQYHVLEVKNSTDLRSQTFPL